MAAPTPVPCGHYQRHCSIVAPCCGKVFCCHRGHEESPGDCRQRFDKRRIRSVVCNVCGRLQARGARCKSKSCRKLFGTHFCDICVIWTDSPAFHCSHCGYCYAGRANESRHCSRCRKCYPVRSWNHPCADCNGPCVLCNQPMNRSRERLQIAPCGHAFHSSCFQRRILHKFSCPRSDCRRPMADMSQWRGARAAAAISPEEFATVVVALVCNDCHKKFHSAYGSSQRCPYCRSYNSRLVPPSSPISRGSSSGGAGRS